MSLRDDPTVVSMTVYQILRPNREADHSGVFSVRVDDTGGAGNSQFNEAAPSASAEESTPQPPSDGQRAERTVPNVEESDANNGGICDRTEAVRVGLVDLIDDLHPTIASCADVSDAHLAAITGSLDLRHSSIDSLKAGDFAGLTRLETLKLARNELRTLPAGVFASLGSLKDLDLWNNELETLPAGVFSGLTSLQDLDMEENELRVLPAGVFDGLSLRFLGLEGNRLRTLPPGLFNDVDVSLSLDLSENELRALPEDVFSGLTGLSLLDLAGNQLRALPAGVFSGLTGLTTLWVDKNPGAPFTFTIMPKRIPGTNKVVATVAEGAPFPMNTTISVIGGTPPASVFPVTVATGRTTSDEIAMTSLGGATATMGTSPPVPEGNAQGTFYGIETAVGGPVTFYDTSAGTAAITSSPGTDETYAAGDAIEVTVTFAESMTVDTTDGIPQIGLTIGTMPKLVGYASGAGTAALVFSYTVAEGDLDTDGVSTGAGSIPGHKVDGVKPLLLSAMVDDAVMTLTYSKALRESPAPLTSAFTVAGGAEARTVSNVAVTGSVVELSLNPAVEHRETGLTVSYMASAGTNTGAIQDLVGNEADGFSREPVGSDAPYRTDPMTNEPPVIDTGNRTTFSYQENGTSAIYTFWATDPEGKTITWSVGGPNGNDFRISETGVLTFASPPDYENPAGVNGIEYQVTVRARDDGGKTASLDVTVTVTQVNEPPTVAGDIAPTVDENSETFSRRYNASDPEGIASTFTWSLSGTDSGDFNIDRSTGELTFRNTPNYESPVDSNRNNEYLVTVRAYDGQYYGTLDVTITVEDVNEAPEFTSSSSGNTSFSFPENRTSAVYTYQATDPEGGTVFWSVPGTDGGDFEVSDGGVLTFLHTPDFENPVDANQDNEYLVTVQARDAAFNTAFLEVVVAVTNSTGTEEPTITSISRPTLTYQENGTATVYTYSATDPQRGVITWSLTGTDAGDFTIASDSSGRGVLTFRSPADFENPADSNRDNVYEITVVATDEQGLTDSFDVTITLTNHHENQEPDITTRPSSDLAYQQLNYQENRTSTVYTYSARNYGSGSMSWSLSGTDSGDFDISDQGALTFESTPNFESPDDLDDNNDYEITVVVTNAGGYTDRLDVVVTVTDVNEGPEITSGGNRFTVQENQEWAGTSFTASDPEQGTVTRWGLGGRDGGDFTISGTGLMTFRSIPDYERPADSDRNNIYEVEVRPYDGRYYGSHDVTVTVTPLNEPPTITTISTSATTLRQAENRTSRLYTYRATDPEGASTIAWSVGGTDGRFFAIDERGQFSFGETSPPDYEIPGDSGGDNVYNVVVQATDDNNNTASLDVAVTVTEVNEGPEISRVGSLIGNPPGTVPENLDEMQVLARYTAVDPEGADIASWSLSGTDGGDFVINQEGELTFRNVPDYERPADSNRDNEYLVSVRASDGRYYGYFAVTVTVEDVNEPPVINTSSRTEFTFTENSAFVLYTFRAADPERETVTWSVSGTDGDDFAIYEGMLTFKRLPDYERPIDSGTGNQYQLKVVATDDRGIAAALDVTVTVTDVNEGPEVSRVGSLIGNPPGTVPENLDEMQVLARYTAVDPEGADITGWSLSGTDGGDFSISENGELTFRNVPDYERPADSNRDNEYLLTVRASDGRYYGYFAVTVTVEDVNEPPEINTGSRTEFTYRENGTASLYTFRAADPERETVTWSVSGTDGDDFAVSETGVLTFKETNPPNYEIPADSDRDNEYQVTMVAGDSGGLRGTLPVTVTVTDVNEGPEVSGRDSYTLSENGDLSGAFFSAVDPEGGDITGWSLSGTDGGDFVINESGQLTFRNTPNYESPADSNRDNEYLVSVRASDGRYYGYFNVTVTVEDVNEPPVINTGSRTEFTFRENGSSSLYTFRATDPERGTITWLKAGVDASFFTIDERGALSFTNPPNFEAQADSGRDNVYEVTVQARDDAFNTASLPVNVNVTDVNEGPEISGRDNYTVSENGDLSGAFFSAVDPEGADIAGWSLSGTDGGDFTINENGELTFRNVPNYEGPADSNRDNEYLVSVRASDGRYYGYFNVTVTVEDVNEPPAINTGSRTEFTYRENGTSSLYTYRASDPERGTITWSVSGADGDDFAVSETGVLSFSTPPNYEIPADSDRDNEYQVTMVATDSGGLQGTLDVTVAVTDVNEGPEVSGRDNYTIWENGDLTGAFFSAVDPEGADITGWSLSGTDGGDFVISHESGELTFRNVPDYEGPADSNRNNEYLVSVRASDGRYYGYFNVTVTVEDVNEPPEINTGSRSEFTFRENGTASLYTYRAADPERGMITWLKAGVDASFFTIDERGALSFTNPPNFEARADSGGDNVYDVTVQARDEQFNTASLPVTVTVTDVNEGPEVSGRDNYTVSENGDLSGAFFSAVDPEGADITGWSLSGTDGGDFTISENGELTFRNTSPTMRVRRTPTGTTSTWSPSGPPTAGTTATSTSPSPWRT